MENINRRIESLLNKWFSQNDFVLEKVLNRNVAYDDIQLAIKYEAITYDGDMYEITKLGKMIREGSAIWNGESYVCFEKELTAEEIERGKKYELHGSRGRVLEVYQDKCIITTNVTLGSIVTGTMSDGEKTIYYVDCVGVQFKRKGVTLGYLQLETAGSTVSRKGGNFFNENTFTYGDDFITDEEIEEVYQYIKQRIEECKNNKNMPVSSFTSGADEIKKFKELLDLGIITQEEFDAKKKQLLGL